MNKAKEARLRKLHEAKGKESSARTRQTAKFEVRLGSERPFEWSEVARLKSPLVPPSVYSPSKQHA